MSAHTHTTRNPSAGLSLSPCLTRAHSLTACWWLLQGAAGAVGEAGEEAGVGDGTIHPLHFHPIPFHPIPCYSTHRADTDTGGCCSGLLRCCCRGFPGWGWGWSDTHTHTSAAAADAPRLHPSHSPCSLMMLWCRGWGYHSVHTSQQQQSLSDSNATLHHYCLTCCLAVVLCPVGSG